MSSQPSSHNRYSTPRLSSQDALPSLNIPIPLAMPGTNSSASQLDVGHATYISAMPAQPRNEATLQRKRSRASSLFHLFTKPNVERAQGHSEPLPPLPSDFVAREAPPERSATRMSIRSRVESRLGYARDDSPPPSIPERPSSRLSFRRLSSMRPSESKRNSRSCPPRQDASWDPPPLFQAYPQALKHISLRVPGSAYDPRNLDPTGRRGNSSATSRHSIFGKPRVRRPDASDSGREGWTKKIYVLVTSGHVLEYAADGPFDRFPEQVLRLGQDSAAFASDLIPGSPYVLQVLQTVTGGVQVVQLPQKSLRSRLGLQSATTRRITTSLLLVFDEPEQMDSWMIAIRKEIELLGGKKCRPISTVGRPAEIHDAVPPPSQRYQSISRSSSRASVRAPSIKSIPSLCTLPTSPTYIPPDPARGFPPSSVKEKSPNGMLYGQQAIEGNRYEDLPLPHTKDVITFDDLRGTNAKTAPSPRPTSVRPPRIESQDFSDFYFTDHSPTERHTYHTVHESDLDSTPPLPIPIRKRPTSNNVSVTDLHSAAANVQSHDSQWEKPQDYSNRTLQLMEHQGSSTTRSSRSWASGATTPRFPLGPKVYSQPATRVQAPAGDPGREVDPGPGHEQVLHPKRGLGSDSYSSGNTDSAQSTSLCSEASTFTEPSSANSNRASINLSPLLLPNHFHQTPTNSTPSTSRPYEPRKAASGAQAPPRIQCIRHWQTSPNPVDTSAERSTPSPSPPNILRRPASLPIHTDPVPFLSSVAKVKGVNHQQRTSVLVPIIRPGTVKSKRKQKPASLLVDLPPQLPPPTSPLPLPPGIAV